MSTDQVVWNVTGTTYHLYQDCRFVQRSQEKPMSIDRAGAARMGFRLCRLCALRETRENSLLGRKARVKRRHPVRDTIEEQEVTVEEFIPGGAYRVRYPDGSAGLAWGRELEPVEEARHAQQ